MRKMAIALFVLVMFMAAPGLAGAVLTFDDLSTGSYAPIPANYGGLTWSSSFYFVNAPAHAPVSGYVNGMVSSPNVAANAGENDVFITASSFDFNGAYFTAAWNDGLQLQITAKNGSTVVGTGTWTLQTSGPLWIGPGWTNITELDFHSDGGTHHSGFTGSGTHFAMDDFNGTAPVPIPGALLLFAPGLAGLAAIRRRLRR